MTSLSSSSTRTARSRSIEPFITGFLQDNKYVGRPVDVMQLKDGSMLVSDDWNGAVYRLSYGKQKSPRSKSEQIASEGQ